MKIKKVKFDGMDSFNDYQVELSYGQLVAIRNALEAKHDDPLSDELYAEINYYLQNIPGPGESSDAFKEERDMAKKTQDEAGQEIAVRHYFRPRLEAAAYLTAKASNDTGFPLLAGDADMVAMARAVLWDPHWAWHAAAELGGTVKAPRQYWRSPPRGTTLAGTSSPTRAGATCAAPAARWPSPTARTTRPRKWWAASSS